jgi:hypothetical protein
MNSAPENAFDGIPITLKRLELLGFKEHRLLNKRFRDLGVGDDLLEAHELCKRAADECQRRARLLADAHVRAKGRAAVKPGELERIVEAAVDPEHLTMALVLLELMREADKFRSRRSSAD